MNDPGDEDLRSIVEWEDCPFCGDRLIWSKSWCTPNLAFSPEMFGSVAFDIAAATPLGGDREYEVLRTCLSCKDIARRFVTQQRRNWDEKSQSRWTHDREHRMGYR